MGWFYLLGIFKKKMDQALNQPWIILLINCLPIFDRMAPFLANNLDKTSEGRRWPGYTFFLDTWPEYTNLSTPLFTLLVLFQRFFFILFQLKMEPLCTMLACSTYWLKKTKTHPHNDPWSHKLNYFHQIKQQNIFIT